MTLLERCHEVAHLRSGLTSANSPSENLLHGKDDRLDVRLQREASRIQQLHNPVWVVAPIAATGLRQPVARSTCVSVAGRVVARAFLV